MRIASVNVNGIRATHRRGFGDWMTSRDCDVLTMQEVRCSARDLPEGAFGGYHATYEPGTIAGRNGVAILTRRRPAAVRTWGAPVLVSGPGRAPSWWEPDPAGTLARGLSRYAREGRYLEADLADAPVTVATLYLPKGGLPARLQQPGRMREAPDDGAKYARKMHFLEVFARQLSRSRRAARARGREFLLTGDLNIAHTRLDVATWRRSQQAEGFLPEECAWLDRQLSPRTLVDVVRRLHPQAEGPYSWWSWLGGAYERDTGWRIDYHLATPGLARRAVSAEVDRDHRGVRLSDHAPVVVDYAGEPN
ncbi:endonuclease/exonuclease/phosphatase family protein [Ruania suaedae]|uniref:exodeoxyribonuclease III n=1 Tax=Ruania suaedae TaxID=2897774 RepID=UPI001E562FCD|nr:exodeoxyribonuclease III [Ruania suaedae]UFU01801.1 endonuclease/exonuclease/phosphatase family protein [Ruania suaedae]